MCSDMVLQRGSAMPKNMKVASLNQEMIRRMVNTFEDLEVEDRIQVVDEYAQQLINRLQAGLDQEHPGRRTDWI